MTRTTALIEETLKIMQQRKFTQGEVEAFPMELENAIKENSRRKEYYKPFTVFDEELSRKNRQF